MANKLIGYCPVCSEKLLVKTLKCKECNTEISGDFELSPFDYLSKEQLNFALVFIKEQGNIKAIEKTLSISYPTVKKNLDDLCNALSVKAESDKPTREDVKKLLKEGKITLDDAERMLGEL